MFTCLHYQKIDIISYPDFESTSWNKNLSIPFCHGRLLIMLLTMLWHPWTLYTLQYHNMIREKWHPWTLYTLQYHNMIREKQVIHRSHNWFHFVFVFIFLVLNISVGMSSFLVIKPCQCRNFCNCLAQARPGNLIV